MSVEASAPRSPQGLALSAAQAACLFAWCLVVRGPTLLPSAIEGDESLYLLIADRMRLGELPYTGVWDHKPAGLYLLFHWSLEVFGRHVASVRLLAILAVFASSLAIFGIARAMGTSRRWAEYAALLTAPFSLLWRCTSTNSEHLFIAPNLVGALLLLSLQQRKREDETRVLPLVGAGLAFGVALQAKYLAGFESAFMLLVYARWALRNGQTPLPRLLREGLIVAVMIALPSAAVAGYFAAHGAWDAFIDANFLANMRHSSAAAEGALVAFTNALKAWLLHTAPLWASSAGLIAIRARRRERPLLTAYEWICVGWLLVGFLEASVTRQFYRHYYLVTLAPLCLLASSLASRSAELAGRRALGFVLAAAIAISPLAAIGSKYYRPWISDFLAGRQDEPRRVAALVRAALKPEDTLYVLDSEPVLYFLADAPPATRFAFTPFLLDPHFSEVARVDYRQEFSRILSRRPRCIVMLEDSPAPRAREFRQMLGPEYLPKGSFETVDVRCRD